MGIRSRNKVSVAFSMSSMTDIVFLLLIFFIIVSTLVSPNAIKVMLPNANSKTTGKQTVGVAITKELKYYVNNQEVSIDGLESLIISELSGYDKKGIVLNADKTIPLENAVKVMDIANRNKFEVVLATSSK